MTFSHNIESVVSDVDDVQDDLRRQMDRHVGAAMETMLALARQYVLQDPNARGKLLSDLSVTERNLTFRLGTSLPYAAIVEFGSGDKTNEEYQYGNRIPPEWPADSSAMPIQMPFDSPDIPSNRSHPKFDAFVGHIMDWMETKGVLPETGDMLFSATLIAEEIIEHGTYAHPFLRPAFFDGKRGVIRAAKSALWRSVR